MNDIKNIFVRLLCLLCVFGAGCKHFDEPAWPESMPDAPNIAIADLHEMVAGRTVVVEQNIVIGGYVTSSDEASNFYRTLTIEDSTGGAEIMVGLYDIHNIFPKDYYLTINLNGCAVGEHYGVMQVGVPAADYSYYSTDYFSSRVVVDKHIKRFDKHRNISPQPLSVSELSLSACGRLVNVANLTSVGEGVWSGYAIFADKDGRSVAIYTSEYATYAQKPLPAGRVSITGVLQYGKVEGEECFIIKMRDEKDCSNIDYSAGALGL